MGFIDRPTAVLAVAALTGSAVLATSADRPDPLRHDLLRATPVALTAASSTLPIWPWMVTAPVAAPRTSNGAPAADQASVAEDEPASTPDQIDASFIDFRRAVRTDFHEFANQLGYLGKQIYVGFNFGESIVASAVFNGTDMMRGEGVLTNLGEIAYDIFLAGVYVVVDELYLAIPGLPPIVALPDRPPVDRPLDWRRPLPPQPGRDLVVPFDPQPEDVQSVASDESIDTDAEAAAAVPDEISEEAVDTEESTAEDDVSGEHLQDAPTEVDELETVEEAETEAEEPATTEATDDEPETDDDGDGDETSDAAEE